MNMAPGMTGSTQRIGASLDAPEVRPSVVRWRIGAPGLLAAAPAAALLNGHASSLRDAALEIAIGPDGAVSATLALELNDAGGSRLDRLPIELPPRRASIEHIGDHLHVHLDGVVTLVLCAGNRPSLRYARTELLSSRLGLAGGVYDAPVLAPSGA